MAFNLRPLGKVINNLMYRDTCTISKLAKVKDKYGATNPNGREVIYKDIPCKFSFTVVDNPGDGNDVYVPVLKEVRIFVDLDYDIKAGDIIEGYRKDDVSNVEQLIKGICGEPNRYDYHQEIPIIIDEEN